MLEKIKAYWDWAQSMMDIDGDVIMLMFSLAIVWKILHHGLTPSDAASYASAVTCFAYSNRGTK